MNSSINHILRFLGLSMLQVLLLKQVTLSIGSYFNILLYPLFILLLPMQMKPPVLVLLGFLIGMFVDMFYGTPGVHASAGAFGGIIRSVVFMTFGPQGGYQGKEPIFSPANVGWQTFIQGSAMFFILYLFWYFSVDSFTFVYLATISVKTLAAWALTMLFVILYAVMFNPKQ